MSSERSIRENIVRALKARGCVVYAQVTGWGGLAGRPDLVVCAKGRFVALEVKRPGAKPTPLQEHRLAEVKRAGGIAGVVYSVADALNIVEENM